MSKPTQKDLAIVIRQLSRDLPAGKLAKTIASYLIQERRTSELDAIMREVIRQRQVEEDEIEVNLTSAFPLSQSVKRELAKLSGAKRTIVNETIDKDVIGGVRMETSESVLDLTVRNRLNRLKQGVKQVV